MIKYTFVNIKNSNLKYFNIESGSPMDEILVRQNFIYNPSFTEIYVTKINSNGFRYEIKNYHGEKFLHWGKWWGSWVECKTI